MKNSFKLIYMALTFTIIFTVAELKAQDKDDSEIGLTVGIDYVSNYIYRGQYYYRWGMVNGGMVSPYVFWNFFETDLSFSIKGEVAEAWFLNFKDEAKMEEMEGMNSIDFNINYECAYKKVMIINFGAWYYLHENAYYNKGLYNEISYNMSYVDFYVSTEIEALLIKPRLAVTYSYYIDEKYARGMHYGVLGEGPNKNGDLYIQLGISHTLKIQEETYFDLDAVVGLLDTNANNQRLNIFGNRTVSTDISDIDLSAGITTTAGILTLSSSFHYVIVPGTQYKNSYAITEGGLVVFVKDIHKFYAKFGVSCSI